MHGYRSWGWGTFETLMQKMNVTYNLLSRGKTLTSFDGNVTCFYFFGGGHSKLCYAIISMWLTSSLWRRKNIRIIYTIHQGKNDNCVEKQFVFIFCSMQMKHKSQKLARVHITWNKQWLCQKYLWFELFKKKHEFRK